ncbi:MMPL family transporter [Salinibacter sp. 10B]|uniref:efflux RND transporter permease subunit n=1 Tax=Salinibacter sp. 10B TaxID=1923971 RepID=UPI0021589E47|nr:MMPL family transporter [Salinibacter sp. 10B]
MSVPALVGRADGAYPSPVRRLFGPARPYGHSFMIERLFDVLAPLMRRVVQHPLLVLVVAAGLAGVGGGLMTGLSINTDFSTLLPESYPSVQAITELRDRMGGENEAAVIIESPSFDANKRFAEALIPKALDLQRRAADEPYFLRVDYYHDVTFIQNNALYFATPNELDSLEAYLHREIRTAKLKANPFYVELDEEGAGPDPTAERLQQLYEDLVTKEYPISDDSTVMAVRLYPSGAQTDIGFIDDAYASLRRLVDEMNPQRFHPDMEVTLGGRLLRQLIEVETITSDVWGSFGAGVLTLLLLVVAYFAYKSYQSRVGHQWRPRVLRSVLIRAPVNALILGLPLLMSLAWTFGVVYLTYGQLNIMTATLGLVLFGLGIDFGIHFYARYAEERGEGHDVMSSVLHTFTTTGQAITVVAITTAAAFFVLMIADFRGFSQFGFTAGVGTVFALLAMLVVLPVLLVFLERVHLLHLEAEGARLSTAAPSGSFRYPFPRLIVGMGIVALGLSLWAGWPVPFQYDFGELEPRYERYEQIKAKWRQVYSEHRSRTAAYVIVDRPEEARAVADALRRSAARDTLSPTVDGVEVLQDRFPMDSTAQQDKLQQLQAVRSLLDNSFLRASNDPNIERLRRAVQTRVPVALDQVPDFLKRPFTTKTGEIGSLVIIYPSVGLANGRNSMRFADDVGTIRTADEEVYHAASTSIVAADVLRLMLREAPWMVGLTLLIVVVFKLIILRRVKWVLLALLPLAASFLWLFGLMALFGWSLNFYNLVVLPTVLGIGDDSGIHVVHRYLEEGRGSIGRVLRSTGEHVTVSALTTMIGFGGWLLSMHPGLHSIGQLAVVGIGLTLAAALIFLPALLQWDEERREEGNPTGETAARVPTLSAEEKNHPMR